MKKFACILLSIILIFAFASCGSSNDEKLENEYYEIVQMHIKKGDTESAIRTLEDGIEELPDSRLLKGLLETLRATADNEEEDEDMPSKTPAEVNETSVVNDFQELRKLYFKWFEDYTFAADKSQSVKLEDYSSQYPVAENGVETYEDLKNLFTKYCDVALFNTYASKSAVKFKDVNGTLHAVEPEIMEKADSTDKDYKAVYVSETEYKLTYNEFHTNFGDVYYYKVTLDYILNDNGDWKFCNERKENMGYVDNIEDKIPSGEGNNNNISIGDILGGINGIIDNTVDGIGGFFNRIF